MECWLVGAAGFCVWSLGPNVVIGGVGYGINAARRSEVAARIDALKAERLNLNLQKEGQIAAIDNQISDLQKALETHNENCEWYATSAIPLVGPAMVVFSKKPTVAATTTKALT